MRTCLIIVGVISSIFVVLIIILAVLAYNAIKPMMAMQKNAQQFVTTSITAVARHWQLQPLLSRAYPGYKALLLKKDFGERLFTEYRKLGPLKKLDPPIGMVYSGLSTKFGKRTTGKFTDQGSFKNGRATINLKLIQVGKTWQIYSFFISSNAFLPALPPTATAPK
ncbi:MAG: hypothetical protein ACP5O1_00790 [Phycisphaerae bacterium]